MRNPKRIKDLMSILIEIWKLKPDIRFNQLIYNLQTEFVEKNNIGFRNAWEKEEFYGRITFTPTRYLDLFYVEDDEFLEFLQWKYNELQR